MPSLPLLHALAFVVATVVAPALAAEIDWKARHEQAVAALQEGDAQKYQRALEANARELDTAFRQEMARDPKGEMAATLAYWLATTYLYLNREGAALPLLLGAHASRSQRFGEESVPVAEVLERLAWIGAPETRLKTYERLLALQERLHGKESPQVVETLEALAMNRIDARRYADAEAYYDRAIAIVEKRSGKEHMDVVPVISREAWLFVIQQRYGEAIPIYRRALAIAEQGVPADDLRLAAALEGLAYAYQGAKRYADAEPLYVRALAIRETVQGPKHRDTMIPVARLRDIYDETGDGAKKRAMGRRLEAFYP